MNGLAVQQMMLCDCKYIYILYFNFASIHAGKYNYLIQVCRYDHCKLFCLSLLADCLINCGVFTGDLIELLNCRR